MEMQKIHALPQRILAGISGGADSVALLMLLRDAGKDVVSVHVNHGLRGEQSDGDEAFVRSLCEAWRIPIKTYRAEPPDAPGEDWARRVRYGFFREAAEETGIYDIALAHHRDDQAETVLLRLLRGSGLTGMTGMKETTYTEGLTLHRPLLDCSREELRTYLMARGQTWREDGSNADVRYLRNALRLEVFPLMERLSPGASARLAQTARILAEDDQALESLAADFLTAYAAENCLSLAPLKKQPPGLQSRILRAWWQTQMPRQQDRSLSAPQTDALRALLDAPAGAKCNLPGNRHGQVGWTHLHLVGERTLPLVEAPVMGHELVEILPCHGEPGDGCCVQALPRRWLADCTIRSRRPGDWLRPFGSEGKKSLQDELVDRRVDAPFRDRVPLLCRGSEVLLMAGVGAGHIPPLDTQENPALLRWTKHFPWQRT